MLDNERISRLHNIVDELLERKPIDALARLVPPFDVERLNDHDSKPAFLLEQETVNQCIENAKAIVENLVVEEGGGERHILADRLCEHIDRYSSNQVSNQKIYSAFNLVERNSVEVGQSYILLSGLLRLIGGLTERKRELDDQERIYWKTKSRPANYYARTIALRLARLYAREKRVRPTLGTARDGGHPSTRYGKALEQVFEALEIKADIRSPAKWAIAQLTDADVAPEAQYKMGTLLGAQSGIDKLPDEVIREQIAKQLHKGKEK